MKRILIAEDDKRIGTALTVRLRAAGYEVTLVPDGFRGYVWAISEKPDLILMDIMMPIGSGLQVAQELDRVGFGGIPVIFITASRKPGLRETAERLGAAGFFEKPFKTEELMACVARVLGGCSIPPTRARSVQSRPDLN